MNNSTSLFTPAGQPDGTISTAAPGGASAPSRTEAGVCPFCDPAAFDAALDRCPPVAVCGLHAELPAAAAFLALRDGRLIDADDLRKRCVTKIERLVVDVAADVQRHHIECQLAEERHRRVVGSLHYTFPGRNALGAPVPADTNHNSLLPTQTGRSSGSWLARCFAFLHPRNRRGHRLGRWLAFHRALQ